MALAFHDRKAIAQQEEHQKIKEYGEKLRIVRSTINWRLLS